MNETRSRTAVATVMRGTVALAAFSVLMVACSGSNAGTATTTGAQPEASRCADASRPLLDEIALMLTARGGGTLRLSRQRAASQRDEIG